jgi:hypothetical protein
MTNSCEHFRTLIDSLPVRGDAEQQDLDGHLASCEECREYLLYASSAAGLVEKVRDGLKEKPVDVAYRQLLDRSRQERRQTGIALTAAVTSLLALVWFTVQDGGVNAGSAILLMWFIGSAVYAWWTSGKARRFLSFSTQPEFLNLWRNELKQKIMLTSIVSAIVGLEIVIGVVAVAINGLPTEGAMILLGLGLVLGTGVLYALIIELPLLKRERSLLADNV